MVVVNEILTIMPHLAYVSTLPCETLMSAKQAISDKLQGSVATYLKCHGLVNNQIKRFIAEFVSEQNFKIGEYLAKLQARAWLSHALCAPSQRTAKRRKKVHETITFLLVTLPNIYRFKKITDRLSNKPFLIWLLTTPSHLKYIATIVNGVFC